MFSRFCEGEPCRKKSQRVRQKRCEEIGWPQNAASGHKADARLSESHSRNRLKGLLQILGGLQAFNRCITRGLRCLDHAAGNKLDWVDCLCRLAEIEDILARVVPKLDVLYRRDVSNSRDR